MDMGFLFPKLKKLTGVGIVFLLSMLFSIAATLYSYSHNYIVAYGDAESHLNISKRIIDSLTPGFAQMGGVWLPLPHLLMVPFVHIDFLWRTGLAGSVVSGAAYILSCIFLYKLTFLITKQKWAPLLAFLIFALNPNILYMQSTPMTELLLIAFFILSTYYFTRFLRQNYRISFLIMAAIFSFCATLTRYDGWFLTAIEAFIITVLFILKTRSRQKFEGRFFMFSSLAFFGIAIWLLWDLLILGSPLYFSTSSFSASFQQKGWLTRGELLTYHNLPLSFEYYIAAAFDNIGIPTAILSVLGLFLYFADKKRGERIYLSLLLLAPLIFYVTTLFLGQSVIFIPELTPKSFQWHLFNVRYGLMMVPFAGFFGGYLFSKKFPLVKIAVIATLLAQTFLLVSGKVQVVTLEDGVMGLSASKQSDAGRFLAKNYDGGLVLLDDYARTISIIRSGIPMESVIYVGNKPYWDISLKEPEKYAKWVVMQKGDVVWENINENPKLQGRLYKYFKKVFTSPDILIFERNSTIDISVK